MYVVCGDTMKLWIFLLFLSFIVVNCNTKVPNNEEHSAHVRSASPQQQLLTTARGSGLAGGHPNTTLTFTIHIYDSAGSKNYTGYAGNMSVWLSSVYGQQQQQPLSQALYTQQPTITDNNDGTYSVAYAVVVVGKFLVHVELNDVEINQSPFSASFTQVSGTNTCSADKTCNKHGACHVDGYCVCDAGFTTADCSTALAPTCYQAEISSFGTSAFFHFSPSVNISSVVEIGCAILDASAVSAFGVSPVCAWQNENTLKVTFGRGATLYPGATVVFDATKLPSLYTPSLPAAQPQNTVVLRAPSSVVIPVGIVSTASAMHNPCADLVLDATASYNSGGRPMTYIWSVQQPATGNIAAIKNYLGTVTNSSIVTIPAKYNTYIGTTKVNLVFTLKLINYLGGSSVVNVTVHYANISIPEVRATPAVTYIQEGGDVHIAGVVVIPTADCLGGGAITTTDVHYSWIRKSGPFILLDGSSNTRILHVSANQLTAGQTYVFELQASLVQNPTILATTTATVYVTPATTTIRILGGNRQVPLASDLTIQSEITATSADSNTIQWTVFDKISNNYVMQDLTSRSHSSSLTISKVYLYLGRFRVTVTMTSSTGEIYTDSVDIYTHSSTGAPSVSIKAPAVVLAGTPLVLQSSLANNATNDDVIYQWSSDSVDLTDSAYVTTSPTLVMPASALVSGARVRFNVTATSLTEKTGWAEVEVVVGDAPAAGSCVLAPSVGIAYSTEFALNCLGFESENQPLAISVWRQTVTNDDESPQIPLQLYGADPVGTTQFLLPDGVHTLVVVVADQKGNQVVQYIRNVIASLSTSQQTVYTQNKISFLTDRIADLQGYISLYDYEKQMQILPGIIATLNTMSAAAAPVKNLETKDYKQRVALRDQIYKYIVNLPRDIESLAAMTSYLLNQLAYFPIEVNATSTLPKLETYVSDLWTISDADHLQNNTIKQHLGVVAAYVAATSVNKALTTQTTVVAGGAVLTLAENLLNSVSPSQPALTVQSQGLSLTVAKIHHLEGAYVWNVIDDVSILINADDVSTATTVRATSDDVEILTASVITWPINPYTVSSNVSTYVREVIGGGYYFSYADEVEIALYPLDDVSVDELATITCQSWDSTSSTWTTDLCSSDNSTGSSNGSIICRCVMTSSSIAVSAYVVPPVFIVPVTPAPSSNKYEVKLSMPSGAQWFIIIGVGCVGILILIGAFVLAGRRLHKNHGQYLKLRSYRDVVKQDAEEPDVTIDELSENDDESSDHVDLSIDEDSKATDFDFGSTVDDVDESLSESDELAAAPNSTRLSRMTQEGGTGYVMSASHTLRKTIETDYDLERSREIGPIQGTALRIRAQSTSTNNLTNSNNSINNYNNTMNNSTNRLYNTNNNNNNNANNNNNNNNNNNSTSMSNFNTAGRYSLAARRANANASYSRASAANLGMNREESLRVLSPTFFQAPATPTLQQQQQPLLPPK